MVTEAPANRRIVRAAGTVMAAIVFSQVMSLLRQVLAANAFGTGIEMEAFNAANRVPETLFTLVAGGALASAFIPTFTGLVVKERQTEAWKLAAALANLVLLTLSALVVLAGLFAQPVVRYALASGFAGDVIKETLTIELLRIMLPSAVLFGLSGLVMGVLNSHQVFFVPALTPSFYQFGMIFGVLVLAPKYGIHGLAWGVVIGAGLHLGLQLPWLWKLRGKYHFSLGLNLPAVREVFRLLGPRLLGVAVVQLNFWVNINLASRQPTGSVTGIVLGFMLMLMPQAAIAQAAATAAMPTLAGQFARGSMDALRASLSATLRGVMLLSIPATVGLIMLRQPLVSLLYERGRFTAESTELVAWALLWYAAGLVGHCAVEVLARAFYAMHDTRTPVLIGAAAMGLNIIFSIAFSTWFTKIGWAPHGGLALANSLATALEMAGLWAAMRRRLGGLQDHLVWQGLRQATIAALAMGAVLWGWLEWSAGLPGWLIAAGGLGAGISVFGLGLTLQGAPEIRFFSELLARRLGKS